MPYADQFLAQEPARAEVDALPGLVLLEFGAPWCPHCQRLQAPLQTALTARPDVRHIKVEDGRGLPLGRSFRIKLWPTLVLMRDGHEVARAVRPTTLHEVVQVLQS
jgi:thioredoxin 1